MIKKCELCYEKGPLNEGGWSLTGSDSNGFNNGVTNSNNCNRLSEESGETKWPGDRIIQNCV